MSDLEVLLRRLSAWLVDVALSAPEDPTPDSSVPPPQSAPDATACGTEEATDGEPD
jgi:hypothetical protein